MLFLVFGNFLHHAYIFDEVTKETFAKLQLETINLSLQVKNLCYV